MNQATLFHDALLATAVLANDITIGRHGGSHESIDANPNDDEKALDREKIYQLIKTLGQSWSKELGRIMNRPIHKFSGRLTELVVLKRLEKTGERKEGCAVLRVTI